MRTLTFLLLLSAAPALADDYVPPPPEQVPGYSATVMPCTIQTFKGEDEMSPLIRRQGDKEVPVSLVECKGGLLANKSLRELSILRNTIYARYGWDGFRKPWLREHFRKQPWFRPNPKFSYKLLSDADRKNAHFIGTYEQSLSERELIRMENDVYARRGKVWNDKPEWEVPGKPGQPAKTVRACDPPKGVEADERMEDSRDCHYLKLPWYRPNPAFTEALLTAEDRVELGLLSRARGEFAVDGEKRQEKEQSLDKILRVEDLRALSLRDLRILRNTIYARRGRPFKSRILQEHFLRMSWYKINPGYSDSLLSATDKRNIALVKSVENEFGGPLKDEDFLIEPAVDLA
jgi:hypothetical protein